MDGLVRRMHLLVRPEVCRRRHQTRGRCRIAAGFHQDAASDFELGALALARIEDNIQPAFCLESLVELIEQLTDIMGERSLRGFTTNDLHRLWSSLHRVDRVFH